MPQLRFFFIALYVLSVSGCSVLGTEQPNSSTATDVQTNPTNTAEIPTSIIDERNCKFIPSMPLQQLDYQGIVPGETTGEQAKNILGSEPIGIDSLSGEWIFPDDLPRIKVENGIATQITASSWPGEGQKVQEMLAEYGCPDFVYAFDQDDDVHTKGGLIVFLNYGIAFSIENNPIMMESEEAFRTYFRSDSPDEFARLFPSVMGFYQPLNWEDAIQIER